MYRFKRLLVGLSLDGGDEAIIRYAKEICRLAKSSKITFVHVLNNQDVPKYIGEKFPILIQTADEYARNRMIDLVHTNVGNDWSVATEYEVVEGSPLIELLDRVKYKEIDLLLVGMPREPAYGGTLGIKLARYAPCSVMIVPEQSLPRLRSLLVPTDFSDHSLAALNAATALARAAGISRINCVHAYRVPTGYYKTGKSYEEFAAIMENLARHEYEEFVARAELNDIAVLPVFKLYKKVYLAIREISQDHPVDLLVIGARGRKSAAGSMLGSVTQRLIRKTQIPLLAVKQKGEGMSFLDCLLEK
jgi:nucleotide-binding universal stress UspA family protein